MDFKFQITEKASSRFERSLFHLDISVFRLSTGVWHILRSAQGFLGLQFGLSADILVPTVFVR
jgi:hypothetical protein